MAHLWVDVTDLEDEDDERIMADRAARPRAHRYPGPKASSLNPEAAEPAGPMS